MHKKRNIALISIAAVLLVLVLICGIYVSDYYHADDTAIAAMAGTNTVLVEQKDDMTVFLPENPETGFIFYPGGKVEYTAYAPLMQSLAAQNILCVLVEMPFNLAVLDMDAAEGIPTLFPEVEDWYIGGHSLGGSMAASYAAEQTDVFDGLVLLAAYSTADLNDLGLNVISVYGSKDGVLNREKYEEYRGNLPEGTVEQVIQGGNHAGFGAYGPQEGDGIAEISPEEQIELTVELLMEFF